MCRQLGKDDLQRGADVAFEQVSAVCRHVRLADDDVRVDVAISLPECDVADEREHFHLFVDRRPPVGLRRPVEVRHYDT
jgi:hypothetical protein